MAREGYIAEGTGWGDGGVQAQQATAVQYGCGWEKCKRWGQRAIQPRALAAYVASLLSGHVRERCCVVGAVCSRANMQV